jgi:hypothetical protein
MPEAKRYIHSPQVLEQLRFKGKKMAHYAQLDANNVVIQVIAGIDENTKDGELYYQMETGKKWKRTSYNTHGGVHTLDGTPFRKNYAGIGYTYDFERDAFIPPKPFNSWVLNENTCLWESPIEYPNDDKRYIWSDETNNWVEF